MGLQNHISRISAFGFLIKYTKISEISRSSHFGGCTKYAKGCIYTGQLLKTATKKKTRQQQKTSKPHLPPRLIWTSKISGGAQIFIPPPNSFYFKKFHFLFPFFKTFLIWTPSLLCSFKKIARSKFFSLLFPFAHFMCCPLLFCFFLNVWFLLLVKFLLLPFQPSHSPRLRIYLLPLKTTLILLHLTPETRNVQDFVQWKIFWNYNVSLFSAFV